MKRSEMTNKLTEKLKELFHPRFDLQDNASELLMFLEKEGMLPPCLVNFSNPYDHLYEWEKEDVIKMGPVDFSDTSEEEIVNRMEYNWKLDNKNK